jgi:hypothetical protein
MADISDFYEREKNKMDEPKDTDIDPVYKNFEKIHKRLWYEYEEECYSGVFIK